MQRSRERHVEEVTGSIRSIVREAAALAGALAESTGLQPSDASALKALDLLAGGPLTPGTLGTSLGLSSAAVTGLVDRLEGAGLARRTAHPTDRRRVHVELTDDALHFGAVRLAPLQARIAAAIAESSDRELAAAARLLARFAPPS